MSRRRKKTRRLSLKPKCTCTGILGKHFLNCDLMYGRNFWPRKRKQFFIFYPLKTKRR